MGSPSENKPIACVFLLDVLCSYRESARVTKVADLKKCFQCKVYKRFIREIESEEDAFFEEVEKIRKFGYPKKYNKEGDLVGFG